MYAKAAERALQDYARNQVTSEELWDIDRLVKRISNWDAIKKEVIIRPVGKKKGEKYMQDKPYTSMGDICAVYGVEIRILKGMKFVAITKDMLKEYGFSTKRLHASAGRNTSKKYPMITKSIESALTGIAVPVINPEENVNKRPTLSVISNTCWEYGEACLFYPEFQEELLKVLPDGGAVIPACRHELLESPAEDEKHYSS